MQAILTNYSFGLPALDAHFNVGFIGHSAQQEMHMIIVTTSFPLPKPVTREEARDIFLSTAPKYQGVKGLLRKHYMLSEDGATAGGTYLWRSEEHTSELQSR